MPETAAEFSRAETALAASSTLMELRQAVLRYATDARAQAGAVDGGIGSGTGRAAGAGAAEPVDRLVGIAHRGQRVPAAEDRGEQHHLRVRGVLELVKQHHLELGAFPLGCFRDLLGDAGCQRDEVPVISSTRAAFACASSTASSAMVERVRSLSSSLRASSEGAACLSTRYGRASRLATSSSTQALASVGGMRCSAHSPAKVTTASISVFFDEQGAHHRRCSLRPRRPRPAKPVRCRAARCRIRPRCAARVPSRWCWRRSGRWIAGIQQPLPLLEFQQAGAGELLQLPADALGQLAGRLAGERHAEDLLEHHAACWPPAR